MENAGSAPKKKRATPAGEGRACENDVEGALELAEAAEV
jgi:hypothetical protein